MKCQLELRVPGITGIRPGDARRLLSGLGLAQPRLEFNKRLHSEMMTEHVSGTMRCFVAFATGIADMIFQQLEFLSRTNTSWLLSAVMSSF